MTLRIAATVETVVKSRGLGGKPLATVTFSVPSGSGVDSGSLTLTISDPTIASRYEPGESVTFTVGGQ